MPKLGIIIKRFPLDRVRLRFQITRIFPSYWNQFFRGRSIDIPRSNLVMWKTGPGDCIQQPKRPIIDESVTANLRTLAGA